MPIQRHCTVQSHDALILPVQSPGNQPLHRFQRDVEDREQECGQEILQIERRFHENHDKERKHREFEGPVVEDLSRDDRIGGHRQLQDHAKKQQSDGRKEHARRTDFGSPDGHLNDSEQYRHATQEKLEANCPQQIHPFAGLDIAHDNECQEHQEHEHGRLDVARERAGNSARAHRTLCRDQTGGWVTALHSRMNSPLPLRLISRAGIPTTVAPASVLLVTTAFAPTTVPSARWMGPMTFAPGAI